MPESKAKRIRFSLNAPSAKKVLLAGDFTEWEGHALLMRKVSSRAKTFSTSVSLAPGTYQYKFIVDGEWVHDPKAETVMNDFGTMNSRITVAD
jgi:1,4-alpha-glucan branching enzyme